MSEIIIRCAIDLHLQARRALRALRGLVRLQSLIQGPAVKRQAANTLRCMQTLSRVQSQILSRRIRMSEENQALHRQLLQKQAKELEQLKVSFQTLTIPQLSWRFFITLDSSSVTFWDAFVFYKSLLVQLDQITFGSTYQVVPIFFFFFFEENSSLAQVVKGTAGVNSFGFNS